MVLFVPQIVTRLGYDTVQTNLHTVAPNITGAVMLQILAYSSDYTRWRFPFTALGFFWTFCGFIIYAAINVEADLKVAYFACFMTTWGTSAPSVLLDVWYNNNIVSTAIICSPHKIDANVSLFSSRREPHQLRISRVWCHRISSVSKMLQTISLCSRPRGRSERLDCTHLVVGCIYDLRQQAARQEAREADAGARGCDRNSEGRAG